jgi:hypothetical protein
LVAVKATLGGKNPFVVLFTSRRADASGLDVPMPTCAIVRAGRRNASMWIAFFMVDGV